MWTLLPLLMFMTDSTFEWPLRGELTSEFGRRRGKMHHGIDISAKEGTWIRAAADGVIVFAGEHGAYGNMVVVRHPNGTKTFYAHLKNYCVFQWQKIRRNQKIGRVGSTGRSTGPHLHFEIRQKNAPLDPLNWLP